MSTAEVAAFRAYQFHGVALSHQGNHGVGDCPFCGADGKFSVAVDTGLWRCWVCGGGTERGGGNALVFIRLLHAQYRGGAGERAPAALRGARSIAALIGALNGNGTSVKPAAGLRAGFGVSVCTDRRLASEDTVKAWGLVQAPDGAWIVPGYGVDGKLSQLYKRIKIQEKGEWVSRLLPTPGVWPEGKAHALHMAANDFSDEAHEVFICEGPWDGMALWEAMPGNSLIVAVPGCNVWRDEWSEFCRGKTVTIMFDSDHPRKVGTSGRTAQAGYDGVVRIAKRLSGIAAKVRWLKWGEKGYDPHKPSGWDVRDHLTGVGAINEDTHSMTLPERRVMLDNLLSKVEDVPREWSLPNETNGHISHHKATETMPCSTWKECEAAWDAALQWRRDMGDALAVLLAVCASTQQAGNQLFLQLVGSAGSGKTTMCDGLLTSHHCHHLEHLTGFHSGWKMKDADGKEDDKDCSLIARINGKTLVTPEADVLMCSPKFEEIMSQQRRIFDGKSGATYKNTDRDTLYSGLRTPWIMAGTPAMMDHDQSHLGDRFIRFIIADPNDQEKRAILKRALRAERAAVVDTANGTAGSIVDQKTRTAHGLTGGYVNWLRANIEEQLTTVDISDEAEDYCIDLAELSADLRARPNEDKFKLEAHECKELPTRLTRQNVRLAMCLAVVLNKSCVDEDVLRIVRKVALDTASGHSLNVVRWLCSVNPKAPGRTYQECGGLMGGVLQNWTGMGSERLHKYLTFLRKIDVLEMRKKEHHGNSWALTERVHKLYLRVVKG